MLKGNCAVCKGSEVFNWEHVNEVMLHDGTRLKWLIYNCAKIEVIIGPDLQYVSIDDSLRLKCQHVDIAQKARQLKELLFHLFTNTENIKQFQRPALTEESDSGDEHVVDLAVSPAFTPETWSLILQDFYDLRDSFNTAKEVCFDNAAGKFFLCDLMRFCCWIKRPLRRYVNLGTNPSGEQQPGCTQLTYYWLKYVNDRSKSRSQSRSQSRSHTPSTPSTSTIPSTEEYDKDIHNIYPDVVFWDFRRMLYRIVGEVKSGNKQPFDNQTTEQMCGLFREHQKYMLGLITKPSNVVIKILKKSSDTLSMYTFPEQPLDNLETIQLIFELMIAFIFCVDC